MNTTNNKLLRRTALNNTTQIRSSNQTQHSAVTYTNRKKRTHTRIQDQVTCTRVKYLQIPSPLITNLITFFCPLPRIESGFFSRHTYTRVTQKTGRRPLIQSCAVRFMTVLTCHVYRLYSRWGPWWHIYTSEWCGCILTVSRITYLPGWFPVVFPEVFIFLSVLLLW